MPLGTSVMTVAAVVRRGGQVLLVQEQTRDGLLWALPGGVVEPQELVHHAVAREVAEETGLTVDAIGGLAYLSQHLSPPSSGFDPLTAFGFEVAMWSGEVTLSGVDEDVVAAEFVSPAEAVARLAANAFGPSVEPARAYISGETVPGTVWMWEVDEQWRAHLTARLDGRG